ncbi:MAG: alpha/beta hydrolase [Burkholderiales bacterium]
MEWGVAGSLLKVAAGAGLALLALFLLQDKLLFHPQPGPRSAAGADSVFIDAADGTRLHAWHVQAPPGAPLVLYFGGNAEEVSWMVAEAARRAPGSAWLLVDYRAYGSSGGAPSESALIADALRWHEHAAKLGRPVYLFGRSLGSGVAVQLAAARPVDGVILVAPYDSMVEVGRRHYPFLPVRWMLKHRFDSLQRAPAVRAPLLCLVAGRDEIIPVVHSKRLYDAWAGPKRWVELPGAGHNSTDGAPEFWNAIRGFLDKKNEKPA